MNLNNRIFQFLCMLLCLLAYLSGVASDLPPDVQGVPNQSLKVADIDGNERKPFALTKGGFSVLFFVTHDCPVSNAYSPEIQRIHAAYAEKKVNIYLAYVDPELKVKDIRKHQREFGHQAYPAIFDREHKLVNAVGATVTPEVALVGSEGKVLYRGRIDNLYADFGKRRRRATKNDLREALDAALAGKPIKNTRTDSIGCFIPKLD